MAKIKFIFVALGFFLMGGCVFAGSLAAGAAEGALDFTTWKPYALGVSSLTSAVGLGLSVWSVVFASKPLTLGEFVSRYSVLKRRINDVDWTVTEEATQTRRTVQEDGEATRAELAAMEARLFEAFQAGSNRPLGADEARSIKEAVAQIFASKEARKRPVQEALSERRFDEAASQLEGLARQSEAAKDDFAGDAADSYREAGALWLGRNTGRAIENFEKARENDPNHFWTHIELTRLYSLAGRTADAHLAAEHSIRQAASDRDRSVALDALANALAAQGRTGEALTAYEEGLGMLRALAAGDGDNAGARRDVSVSLERVGDMLAAQGRTGEALTMYEEGLGMRRALAAGDADNAGARRDVSVSLIQVGNMLAAQGRTGEALTMYEEGLGITRALAAGDADNAGARRDVSVSLERVGNMLAAQGRTGEALTMYEEGLGITRALAAGDADNAGARRDVSTSLERVGDMLAAQGRTGEALTMYEEGFGIARALAAGDGDNAGARRDVYVSLVKVGDMLAAQGRSGEALTAYEEGLDIARALAAGDADNAGARRDVSVSLGKVGDMLAAEGRAGEALTSYEEGLDIARALAAGDADNAPARRGVIVSLAKLASLKGGADSAVLWREAHERACAMDRDGVLGAPDHWMIEDTRRKAEGAAE